jgi:hypothetical protein
MKYFSNLFYEINLLNEFWLLFALFFIYILKYANDDLIYD